MMNGGLRKISGCWHIKNSKTRQKRSCYDATYISNEVGARDSSFSLNNSNDIILIGDHLQRVMV